MKKATLILVAVLTLSTMLMVIAPAFAKPVPTVIVTVKDSTGKPVVGAIILLADNGQADYFGFGPTNLKGTISCPLQGTELSTSPGAKIDLWYQYSVGSVLTLLGTVTLNHQGSGKITVTTP
jgi:hypothetical protein